MIDGNKGNDDITSHAREKTIEHWLNEGVESFDSKRYHEALAAYEQVIRLDPDFAYAYQKMAQTLIYLGRYEEASDLGAKARQKQREQDKLPGLWKRVDMQSTSSRGCWVFPFHSITRLSLFPTTTMLHSISMHQPTSRSMTL